MFTQASDLFLYMLAFAFSNEVHWVEFRLVHIDRKSGKSIREHLFFLPRVETATWNLRRIRGQLLDTVSWHGIGAIGTSFRLFLSPRLASTCTAFQSLDTSFASCATHDSIP
ncbi:unnamed protein product [Penicillium salamii]|uniref:Uncharacterized protein n=1 Tax=Penicillium salamii TaxID=1612424 RepID=A0A9W4NHB2_9EURO|nr:unnamed protein product [Penicillium salamii]CAG8126097.1 unnamed protein product [Penicillium salamii]CAG8131965.1 unnamed protein product [Penicillium salamii]CAG8366868.1 unnamed protein product [Penicillium salamii]